jgi:hypothetical protein
MLKLALAAFTAFLVAFPVLADERIIKASDDSALTAIRDINAVYNLDDEKNHLTVRLFLRSAGDPAMNGNQLLLAIIPAPERAPHIWNTGIDIDTVRTIVRDPGKTALKINVVERYQDDQHAIKERLASYTIRYDVDTTTGSVADTLHVGNEGNP